MTVGDRLTLRIDKPVAGGRMLAHTDEGVVLVAGALPGEVVEARVERLRRGTAWAATVRVIEASAARVGEPNPCGGSVLAHASYPHQLELKQQIVEDAFARVARLTVERPAIVPSPAEGYRMRARLHVQDHRLGFYLEGTHTLCDPATTGQLLPATVGVLDELARALPRATPDAVAVDIAENRDATERGVHVELQHGADPSRLGALAATPGITTLSFSHVGSPRVRVLSGDGRLTDRFEQHGHAWTLCRATRAFFQGNRFLLDALVGHVVGALVPGGVTDLYAGVGLFAVAAAAAGHAPVTAVEGDARTAADLLRNGEAWRGLMWTRHEPVEAYLAARRTARPHTLILDPPRTGLSRRALEGVAALGAPRVVYVSCDVPTLARDVRGIVEAGYRLTGLRAFDLFPHTAHVETVAVLDR